MERLKNSFKTISAPFKSALLLMFLTGALFAPSQGVGQSRCESIFQVAEPGSYTLPLIRMNEMYRGEEKGLYVDPLTNRPWQVKYFDKIELAQFELRVKDGLFITPKGERMDSPFDGESLSYDTGLIVIDRSLRTFLMPFETRGQYHHSSLSGGKDILFAGTASFSNGRLREFTNDSGHYKPTTLQTLKMLRTLYEQGVDLSGLKLGGRAIFELTGKYSMNMAELKQIVPDLFAYEALSEAQLARMVSHIPQ